MTTITWIFAVAFWVSFILNVLLVVGSVKVTKQLEDTKTMLRAVERTHAQNLMDDAAKRSRGEQHG